MSKDSVGQNNKGGFALLVVILVMLISSFLASQLIMLVRADLKISANNQQTIVGRMLAEAGINLALFRRLENSIDLDYEEKLGGAKLLGGYLYETVLPTGKIEYYVVNELGKIDLNNIKNNQYLAELLINFLIYKGLETEEAEIIKDSVVDWTDSGDEQMLYGAESDYYAGLENPYIPRNGNMEDPAELFLIRGTEKLRDLYMRGEFDPYAVFTVNNKTNKLDINQLTPDMLDFLVGGDKERAKMVREEQKLRVILNVTNFIQIIEGEALRRYFQSSTSSSALVYSIVAYGYPGDPSEFLREETVESDKGEIDGDGVYARQQPATKIRVMVEKGSQGFRYLSWREQSL